MNGYTPKPNSGTLWTNDYKRQQNQPDMRGDAFLDRSFLRGLLDRSSEDLIKVSIAGWNKTTNNGRSYMSLSVSEPYEKPNQDSQQTYQQSYQQKKPPSLPPQEEEEIPF